MLIAEGIESLETQNPTNLETWKAPATLEEAFLISIPIIVSALAFGFRELMVSKLKSIAAEQAAEIEMQKANVKQQSDRIEYLEKQNQMLLTEILNLRQMLQMSGPLSLSMYDPRKK
jgi:hypothetical protein